MSGIFRQCFVLFVGLVTFISPCFCHFDGDSASHGADVGVDVDGLGPCDPLDESFCSLPFPNDFYRIYNSTVGDFRLNFTSAAFPTSVFGEVIDPVSGGWNDLDGFSPSAAMVTYVGNVSLDNVAPYWNVQQSLHYHAPIVLLDTHTGEILPHWAELDFTSGNSVRQLFMIWPASRLRFSRRYIIALRFLKLHDDSPVNSSFAFTALRDNVPTNDSNIESRRPRFEDIFHRLAKVGVKRHTLQLAWDFTTGSQQSLTGRLLFMRDDVLQRMDQQPVQYNWTKVENNVSATVARRLTGALSIPQYVNTDAPGAVLIIDPNTGLPLYQRSSLIPFTVLIPPSIANGSIAPSDVSIVAYGHGLFGSCTEVNSDYLTAEANQYGYILCCTNWIGLTQADEGPIIIMLATALTRVRMIPDRTAQAVINVLAMVNAMKSAAFSTDQEFDFGGGSVLPQNAPSFFNGNSLGGVLGTVHAALSTQITRSVLGVYGGPFALLLPRNQDFSFLLPILKARYKDSLQLGLLLPLINELWSRTDPSIYAHHIHSHPLPNTPKHSAVLVHAIGDQEVSYVGAYWIGRSAGAKMRESNLNITNENGERQQFGYTIVCEDEIVQDEIMQVTYDFPNVPLVPRVNLPPPINAPNVHGWPRLQISAQQQMYHFFKTGEIVNYCGGPCHGNIPSS